ncbi:MAG: hypothetical protein FGM32_10775 [Candidatus Kapabacteria bacterium]|nr:hypothetical protein [Candidatus Kapabacteria bacterium]
MVKDGPSSEIHSWQNLFLVFSCVCLLVLLQPTRLLSVSDESVLFLTTAGSCQTACSVTMHNFERIVRRHLPANDSIPTRVFITDVRKAAARYYSEQLRFELQDSLDPLQRQLTKGMQTPIAVLSGTDRRLLVVDDLTKKDPAMLDSLVGAFLAQSLDPVQHSYIESSPLRSLHEVEISSVQSLSDSVVLIFDRLRGEALIASITNDQMLQRAQLPASVKYQFKDSTNEKIWTEYERMGVKMTQVLCAYVPDTANHKIVFAITQYYLMNDGATGSAAGTDQNKRISGRNARWQFRPDTNDGARHRTDSATQSMIGVFGLAPQRIGGVTLLNGGTKDMYSNDPDAQFIVTYADEKGEHLVVSRSHVSSKDSSFDFSSLTRLSGMYEGRVMIANFFNGVFGVFDTASRRIHHLQPMGPLHALFNNKTRVIKVGGFIGPYMLLDTAQRRFHVVSLSVVEETLKSAPLGLVVNTFDFDSGQHLCMKAFYTETEIGLRSLLPFNVRNAVLYAVSQGEGSTELVKIKL